jgi:hypothetical protein
LRIAAPGSRKGHGTAKKGPSQAGAKAGWLKSVVQRKQEPEMDSGEGFSIKGGSNWSFTGGSLMNGKQLPTLVIADKALDPKKMDLEKYAPKCWLMNPDTNQPLVSRFVSSASGGMETATNVDYVETILDPATGRKRRRETTDMSSVQCCDGLGQHISCPVLKVAKKLDHKIALRWSHGSHMNQKEDFVNYAKFKPAFALAKRSLQSARVSTVIKAATLNKMKPRAKDMQAGAFLSVVQQWVDMGSGAVGRHG